jgi:hypothetical protein
MTIMREYHDKDGNYWENETPHYIPPEEAIKNPAYVRGCITAEERRNEENARRRFERLNRNLNIAMISLLIIMGIVLISQRTF